MTYQGFGAGKVILFGEHSVVYGEPAVAAALSVGVRAEAEASKIWSLTLSAPGWDFASDFEGDTPLDEGLRRLRSTLEDTLGTLRPAVIHLTCDLPTGAGLGSSSALAVAVARVILHRNGIDDDLDLVLRAAMASEGVFHGTPSGIDHTTSAKGGLLRFQRTPKATFHALPSAAPLRLLVAQVEPGASTAKMVAGVRELWEGSASTKNIVSTLGSLAEAGQKALEAGNQVEVGRCMNAAHDALKQLGVSTPALDEAQAQALSAGAFGAKLTGSGGGGCVIALVSPDLEETVLRALEDVSMRVFATSIG